MTPKEFITLRGEYNRLEKYMNRLKRERSIEKHEGNRESLKNGIDSIQVQIDAYRSKVDDWLEKLPKTQRQIVKMKYVPSTQINWFVVADEVGMNEQTCQDLAKIALVSFKM